MLKKLLFHPSSQAPTQAQARSPGPRPGPLRRRMENLNLRLEKFEKIVKIYENVSFWAFFYNFRVYFREKMPFWAFCIGIKLNFQAVIKSAASAASPIAWGAPRGRRPPLITA